MNKKASKKEEKKDLSRFSDCWNKSKPKSAKEVETPEPQTSDSTFGGNK